MPRIRYKTKKISPERLAIIAQANDILEEFAAQGFDMTLRQIYYKFISRDLFPESWIDRAYNLKHGLDPDTKNTVKNYKRLGDIVGDGRMCGLIDWDRMEDRTRNINRMSSWTSPASMIDSAFQSYHRDRWANQPYRVEVWCFPPDIPVVTRSGVTPIGGVQIGEKVMTHTGEFERVTELIKHEHDGEMIEVKATGLLPIRCTPNHKFWVYPCDTGVPGYKGKKRRYGKMCWKEARELNKFDMLILPRTSMVRDEAQMFMLGGPRSESMFVPLDHDLLRFVGHYLAEGNVMLDGRTVQFTFSSAESDHAVFVEQYARQLGLSSHTYVEKSTVVVYVFSTVLAKWLDKEFGCGAYHKRLPEWFMLLPHDKQMTTVHYHFLGDGTLNDKSRSALLVSTRSECLARQEQLVLLRCGYFAALHSVNDHGSPMYRLGVSGESGQRLADRWGLMLAPRSCRYNHIRLSGSKAMFPVRSVKSDSYKGIVCNLEVEHDHSYCVPVAVHNCEKEALIGIFATVCEEWDIPYFACRGYSSLSEAWRAAMRFKKYKQAGQRPVVLHFGDHDPSGIDMTRDIGKHFEEFGVPVKIVRLALNMDQVEAFSPPSNPAKSTDARYKKYVAKFGPKSWELDALDPPALISLVEDAIRGFRDEKKWAEAVRYEIRDRAELKTLRKHWPEVSKLLCTEHTKDLASARRTLRRLGSYQAELEVTPGKKKMRIFEDDGGDTDFGLCERCGIGLDVADRGSDAGYCRSCQEEVDEEGDDS